MMDTWDRNITIIGTITVFSVIAATIALIVVFTDFDARSDKNDRYQQCVLANAHEVNEVQAYCRALEQRCPPQVVGRACPIRESDQ